MDNRMEQLLNPENKPLNTEQKEVVETFTQVDQEMKRLDRLAQQLGGLNTQRERKGH